ncbi:MAG: hypothetical protein EON99_00320 [Chitinophagaceae bacterium]|nr:MAG: hypothetical protein EON99_00320 [Chitinophagaceae bacterium]
MVEYIKGQYCVVVYDNSVDRKILLRTGVRVNGNEVNPNYPLLAWDPKGTLLTCIWWAEGKVHLFRYDMVKKYKPIKNQVIEHFEQIQDMKYMLNNNTLLLSAVRKGQSDLFVYKIDDNSFEQITNDAYADLDPTFVAFPGKTGILFSSNRPNGTALGGDTAVPNNRYNIFMIDNWNKTEFKQISQLTNMRYGTARFPTPYNTTHFTFISDDFGVANRYAGYFRTTRAGLDTVYVVADQILRNPEMKELDSTLQVYGKSKPDTVYSFQVTTDSAYVFPISNYQSALLETKIAGQQGLVSETRQQGNLKFLYKLKVDEQALKRRNINPKPTEYRKRTITEEIMQGGKEFQTAQPEQDLSKNDNAFESEFENDNKKDSSKPAQQQQAPVALEPETESVLRKAKLFDYKLKFSADNFSAGFNNDILINRYEPYTGSLPVVLQSGGAFNGMLKASVFDLFEDIRFTGAVRLPLISGLGTGAALGVGGGGASVFVPVNQSLFDGGSEWFGRADYLKHRLDYSLIYYRKTEIGGVSGVNGTTQQFEAKQFSNLYQLVIRYPFDRVRSLRLSAGIRNDRVVVSGTNFDSSTLKSPTLNKQTYAVTRLEYVYDNVIMKATNIYNGLRYKIYGDLNAQISKPSPGMLKPGRYNFNVGTDIRYYHQIWRNFIWAGRGAADFSWGNQKILYYLGGIDGWMFPKYSQDPRPAVDDYAYQSLAVNMRGFNQNVANGNNAMVLNSEFRFPVFATLFNKPINNAFLRNFQVTQFIDLGTAWNGEIKNIARPSISYPNQDGTAIVKLKAGGVGPLVGGYGFGVRSTLLGYFLKLDCAWEMNGFFKGKPLLYFGMGVDF